MTRSITSTVETAIAQPNVAIAVAVELFFDGGTVRLTNAGQSITYSGNTYLGIGQLGAIDVMEEGADLVARGIKMQLSGIPTDMVSIALAEDYQGRVCKVCLAFLNVTTYAVLSDPLLVFDGRMDTMSIEMGKTATILLTAESRLIDLQRPRVRRYNHEDQIAVYPADRFFEYMHTMVNRELLWGRG